MNQVTLVGFLGRDNEKKTTQGGTEYVVGSIATTRYAGKDEDGRAKRDTEWHRLITWEKSPAFKIMQYGKKGNRVALTGEITYQERTTDEGKKLKDVAQIRVINFEILEKKDESKPAPKPEAKANTYQSDYQDTYDDDPPF